MFLPKISIITITFNSEKTLEETINSIIGQNYENLEYLIIDGGSKDGTMKIVDNYREKIAFTVSEPDKGISDAFNKGIAHATGEIIGIINSDDILLPGALAAVAEQYSPDIDVYSGNVMMWNEQTGNYYIRKPSMSFSYSSTNLRACHPGRFIARRAYEKYGVYSVEMRYRMDLDLLLRFYNGGAKFIHIDQPLTKFRVGGASSDTMAKKRNDFYLFVTNNGGSKLDFYILWIKANIKYLGKRVLFALFGEKLKYKNR